MKKYLVISFSFLLSVVSLKAQVEIVSAGTGAAYTLNVPGVFPLTNGIQVTFKAHTSCSASATMNVTGTGARSIMKEGNTVPLTGGDIKAGQIVTLAYDGTNWQMLSPIGNSATSSVNGTTNRVIKFTSASTGGDSQITDDGTNVGIGTSTPAHQLELFNTINSATPLAAIINGHANGDGALRFSGGATHYSIGSDNSDDAFKISNSAFGLGTTDRFTITSSGAVGIGTASPGATFEVFQSTNPQLRLKSSAGAGVVFDYNNTAFSILNYDNTPLYFATGGGSTKMNIQSNGDVGIGTGVFTPTAKLHVIGGARITDLAGPGTVIADASGNLSVVGGSTVTGTGTTNYLARWTSATQLGIGATFDNGTSVGIGTPTPGKLAGATKYLTLAGTDLGVTNTTASFEIVGNTGSTNTMASKVDFLGLDPVNATIPRARVEARSGNGATLAGQLLFYTNSTGAAANLIERMRIRESGEVGIGNVGVVGSLLSIGASNQFRVSSAGDLTRINDVPYTWPAANAAGFLSNDGAGTLSWSTAGVLAGGTASKVTFWTSANSVSANNSFSWDNTNIRLGVGIAAPDATLNVDGTWDIGTANSITGVIAGAIGSSNTVSGNRALALGNFTNIANLGAMVLGDYSSGAPTVLASSVNDQFSARFSGGYRFYTNSTLTATQGIYFSNLGKVGIGVAAPLEVLHIESTDSDIDLETYSTTESSSLHIKRGRGTYAAPTIPSSGDYYGGVGFQAWDGTAFQEGARIQGVVDGTVAATDMPGRLEFWTSPDGSATAVERMRITSAGDIGIGTSSPDNKLHVAETKAIYDGSDGTYIDIQNTDATGSVGQLAGVRFRTDGVGAGVNARYKGGVVFQKTGSFGVGDILFLTNSVGSNVSVTAADEKMRITSGGFVGIGENAPIYNLDVSSTTTTYAGRFKNTGTAGADGLRVEVSTAAVSTGTRYGTYSYLAGGLSLQYGTLGQVASGGTTNYGIWGSAAGGTTNYGVYCNGSGGYTGTWTLISDQRFKENIKPLTGALEKILLLEPKTYNLKTKEYSYLNFPTGTQIGLIAQEVEKVIPELVEKGSNPGPIDPKTGEPAGDSFEFKTMNYIGLTPVLVQAIKEQQAQIEELKKQLEEQKKQIEKLEKK